MSAAEEVTSTHASANPSVEMLLRILKAAAQAEGSDIHLKAGGVPRVRVRGQIVPLKHPPLDPDALSEGLAQLARYAFVPAENMQRNQFDFAWTLPNVARYRFHVFRQSGHWAATLRVIPSPIPDFAALRLPPVIKRLAHADRGLLLVTGATGNGKSTTIASMLSYINAQMSKQIVTVEDPVEYEFEDDQSSFVQREVGRDVSDWQQALEGAMREDPDIIMLGELRNAKEFEVALNAAESGRLVVSTLHSGDCERALTRMYNFFPPEFQQAVRHRIADVLIGIVSQRLVPQERRKGKVLVTEVLTRAPSVIDCIRDPARHKGLAAAIEKGTHEYGCHTFDQMFRALVRDKVVSLDTAKANVRSANDFVRAMNMM